MIFFSKGLVVHLGRRQSIACDGQFRQIYDLPLKTAREERPSLGLYFSGRIPLLQRGDGSPTLPRSTLVIHSNRF